MFTCTLLIKSFCKFGSLIHTHQLFAEMFLKGWVPNTVTLTALIDGHCKPSDKNLNGYERGPVNSTSGRIRPYSNSNFVLL